MNKPAAKLIIILFFLIYQSSPFHVIGQYSQQQHQTPGKQAIAIDKAGSYGKSGATYVMTNDISSAQSAIFLGKDVTLDLNGYTLSYADGGYEHVPNYGFEEGLKGWDISKAPGAKVVNTKEVHAFIGDKLMSLQEGDEIVSQFIHLPIADRSYYAMCGITGRYYQDLKGDLANDMKLSIYVEDEKGNNVKCVTQYGDTTLVSCPVEKKSPRLGGGFIVAHLNKLPAGKYRVRIKADTDCLIDQVDIRPAMDVGIGIVDVTHPYGHYDHLYEITHSAFFDYTQIASKGTALSEIPKVEGEGTVIIKNGIIKSGTRGILSWGIQSTAENVKVILSNVKIISSGINAVAVDVPYATITNCTFDIDNPFIINRHGSQFYAVDLVGLRASEVSFSEFYGGQGCLVVKGINSSIHNNLFVNRQVVTNHYSIMAMGDSSKIFENRFEPEVGSGIEIFRHKGIEIFSNTFKIEAAPPSCEYNERYSTNAIRVADYGAEKNSPRGAYGNRIYNNTFYIKGMKYKEYPDYIPLASAVFYSTSAGDNHIFGNRIFLEQQDPGTDAEAYAFYIGNADGGHIYNNYIEANVPPIWVASAYGSAANTSIYTNVIKKSPASLTNFKPIRIGYSERNDCFAKNILFQSNDFIDLDFAVDVEGKAPISYLVSWTLKVNVKDKKGKLFSNESVRVVDNDKKEVYNGKTKSDGSITIELMEHSIDENVKTTKSPYVVMVRNKRQEVFLNKNTEITMTITN